MKEQEKPKQTPEFEIKKWTITNERIHELWAAEDRDQKVLKIMRRVVGDCSPGSEVERSAMVELAVLYEKELRDE